MSYNQFHNQLLEKRVLTERKCEYEAACKELMNQAKNLSLVEIEYPDRIVNNDILKGIVILKASTLRTPVDEIKQLREIHESIITECQILVNQAGELSLVDFMEGEIQKVLQKMAGLEGHTECRKVLNKAED